jgi:hypothetical protein
MRTSKGGWATELFKGFYIWKWGFGFNEGMFAYKYLPEIQINHPSFYFVFGWWLGIKKRK